MDGWTCMEKNQNRVAQLHLTVSMLLNDFLKRSCLPWLLVLLNSLFIPYFTLCNTLIMLKKGNTKIQQQTVTNQCIYAGKNLWAEK